MLKKIICALLAAAVIVSATACQGVSEEQKTGQTPEQKGGFIENEVIFNSSEDLILLSQGNVKSIIVNFDGTVNCLCMYDLASDEEGIKQSVFAINGNEGEPLCKDFGAKFGESYNLLSVDEGYAYAETYQSKSASFTESTIMMASITDDNSEAVRLSILDALPQNVEKKVFQLQALPQNRYIVAVLNSESQPSKLNYFVIDAASNESYELLSNIEVSAGLTIRYISETDELAIRRQKDGKGSVGVFSLGEKKMLSEETTFSYEGGYSILAGADAEAIYFVDGGGINRVTRGGTIVERIMEAKRYELNSPQWTPLDAVRTPDGEFYVTMFNNILIW
ncbi:MAG: hypothetical protein GX683_00735 [Ruminococcaceae bacterium]|nr:hypothetical protein [Oscillospiraceae bacterium]